MLREQYGTPSRSHRILLHPARVFGHLPWAGEALTTHVTRGPQAKREVGRSVPVHAVVAALVTRLRVVTDLNE